MRNSPAKVEPDDGDAAHSAGADAQPPSPEKTSKSASGCEAAVAPECLDRDDVASIADRRGTFVRMLGFWLLPSIALLLALGAAYFKYQEGTASDEDRARVETVQVATEATVAMLSYTPETAEKALMDSLATAGPRAAEAVEAEDFAGAMAALASLRAPIDAFFDSVTVNDPDPEKRIARLDLLDRFRGAVHNVADFSRIEG